MSALSEGSAAAKISSSFSENPNIEANQLARAIAPGQLPYDKPVLRSATKQSASFRLANMVRGPVENRLRTRLLVLLIPRALQMKTLVALEQHPPPAAQPSPDLAPRGTRSQQLRAHTPAAAGAPEQPTQHLGSDLPTLGSGVCSQLRRAVWKFASFD